MLAIYIRKSRERAKEKSIKEQRLLGQEFAVENQMEYKFYDEGIISGQKSEEDRPKFSELLKDIRSKKINGVYIWDSSRLARNEIAWHTFADLLKNTGTLLYDNGVETDFKDENTYLFYTIKAGMDAHFARLTAKKIKTVLRRNAIEGIPHGIAPFGYTKDENGKWKIHEEKAKTVLLIFELYQQGYGYIRIANHLNELGIATRYEIIWTPATIRYMIYNKTYSGRAKHNELELKVPAIIDKDIHDKLIDDIGKRYKKPGSKSKKFILNEVLFCAKCGSRYTVSQRHRHSYYRCLSEVNRGVPKCGSKAVRAWAIDKLVFEEILLGQELYELAKKTYEAGGNENQKNALKTKQTYHLNRQEQFTKETRRNYQLFVTGGDMELYNQEKKRIDKDAYKTDEILKEIALELEKVENSNRVLLELKDDFKFNLFERYVDLSDPYKKEYFDKSMKDLVNERIFNENKQSIIKFVSFEEKVSMVKKYIKKITVNYPEIPLKIKVEFNIPLDPMEIIVESRYYGALDLETKKEYILKDFGKQPLKIYHRMKTEFSKFSDVETFDIDLIKKPFGFLNNN
ncbi:DNA invertase Pin-like site-specific DNA recombinase [Maribacter spongiicola]|uniref:DNA invertase Pin-like site-specific DNA recombinase n=1 Tax=Maribacter spongiicola TaxID=1206753 RepID=A0A4R7JWZ0_9FLAO|nr:recombinase family protein [Maribacter spongiicola]TDT41973.1 DNA invertase Pin-like site-specific DNA recombinase [Maribacter spongiicola]